MWWFGTALPRVVGLVVVVSHFTPAFLVVEVVPSLHGFILAGLLFQIFCPINLVVQKRRDIRSFSIWLTCPSARISADDLARETVSELMARV